MQSPILVLWRSTTGFVLSSQANAPKTSSTGESSGVNKPCSFSRLLGLASGDLGAALRLVGDSEVIVFIKGLQQYFEGCSKKGRTES